MIILGIDPGTTQIGFGIIKKERSLLTVLDYGIIRNLGRDKLLDYQRTSQEITKLTRKHRPTVAAIEKIFFFKNQKTVISVSEMRGVIILSLLNHNVSIYEFTPLQIKQAVASYGRADKDQVKRMVKLILNIKEGVEPDDAADALAIAICCANNILVSINK